MQSGLQGLLESICRDLDERPLLLPFLVSPSIAAPNNDEKGSVGGPNIDLIAAAPDALLAPVSKQPEFRCRTSRVLNATTQSALQNYVHDVLSAINP